MLEDGKMLTNVCRAEWWDGLDANMNIVGSVSDEIVIDMMCAMVNVRFKMKVFD